jgi:segregation and condensation protein B
MNENNQDNLQENLKDINPEILENMDNINEIMEQMDEESFEEEVDAMIEANLSFGEEVENLMDAEEVEEIVEAAEAISDTADAIAEEAEQLAEAAQEQDESADRAIEEAIVQADEAVEEFDLELDFLDEKKQQEKEWKERTGLDEQTLGAAIETIIFMSDRPVAIGKIKKTIDPDMPLRPIYDAISHLQENYEQKHHGIRLVEVAEGYQFRTKLNYASYVETINKSTSFTLSPTALEVLAIIAYRQPVSRTEIDKMRGVDSSHIVRALMDKRLVSIAGRSEELGRPTTYKTTPEFLEFFNLNTIEELPPESELVELTKSNVGSISDIKEICKFDAKEKFVFDDIEELDELSDTIKEISADTDFTKSLKAPGEDGQKASPFDLMETFLEKQTLEEANQSATESEFMSAVNVNVVNVVSDLVDGPFNEPEEEDEGDFLLSDEEMAELEELEAEANELDAQDEAEFEALESEEILEPQEDGDLYAEAPQEEREELIAEFQELQQQESQLDVNEEELEEQSEELTSLEDNVEEVQNMAAELAEDLDLDLSFMKQEISDTSETSEPENTENTENTEN